MNPFEKHSQKWFEQEFVDRGGRDACVWSEEERKILHGSIPSDLERTNSYNEMLIERFIRGLPLSKADIKKAKSLIRNKG